MKAHLICSIASAVMIVSSTRTLADETLAIKSGCLECHEQKLIGPPFRDIAANYKGDSGARDVLIETVKHGGKGHWTEVSHGVPMPPYSGRLSDAEIQQLVDWVLAR